MPTLSIKHGAVKYRVPQAEVEALHRRVQLEAAGLPAGAEAGKPIAAAPAEQPMFTGLLTLAGRNARLEVCKTCEHFTELSACGCNPFCGHQGLRNMKASLRPNHWLRAAQCPSGKWPEPPADLGA